MKFMISIYADQAVWDSFPAEDRPTAIAAQDAFNQELFATGELLAAYGLADVVHVRTVRVRHGVAAIANEPYLDTREHPGSYHLVDVDTEERALEIAALMPFASFDAVEVWPVLHEAGAEM